MPEFVEPESLSGMPEQIALVVQLVLLSLLLLKE